MSTASCRSIYVFACSLLMVLLPGGCPSRQASEVLEPALADTAAPTGDDPSMDGGRESPAQPSRLAGTWSGLVQMRSTYTSVYGDDTSSAEEAVEFTFGEDGLPTSIPVCEGHSFNLVDARIGATQSYSVELPYGDEPIDFTITMTQLEHGDGYLYMRFEWDFELYTGLSEEASSLMESREEYQFELDGDVLMYTHDVFMSGTLYSEWGPSPSTMTQHDSAELTRS